MKNKKETKESLWCECKEPKYIGDIYGEKEPHKKEIEYKVCDKCYKPNKDTKTIKRR